MRVVSFLNSVPRINKNPQKTELLIKFIQGVNLNSDEGILHNQSSIASCDVAVIQGWVHNKVDTVHLQLRKNIIDHQVRIKKHTCVADSNLFLYANKLNSLGYLRYSFDGVFPNTGIYFDSTIDNSRWMQISKDFNITLEDNKKGSNILICAQREGGWSMGSYSIKNWLADTLAKIRNNTDRKIIIRAHPGDKSKKEYLNLKNYRNFKNVEISNFGTPLENDLRNCYAVVNHNSSSIVGPIIQGYHAFITDPDKSQCAEVAHTDFSLIESPQEFNRQRWVERISMFHWKFSELEDGSAWRHMRNYVRQ